MEFFWRRASLDREAFYRRGSALEYSCMRLTYLNILGILNGSSILQKRIALQHLAEHKQLNNYD